MRSLSIRRAAWAAAALALILVALPPAPAGANPALEPMVMEMPDGVITKAPEPQIPPDGTQWVQVFWQSGRTHTQVDYNDNDDGIFSVDDVVHLSGPDGLQQWVIGHIGEIYILQRIDPGPLPPLPFIPEFPDLHDPMDPIGENWEVRWWDLRTVHVAGWLDDGDGAVSAGDEITGLENSVPVTYVVIAVGEVWLDWLPFSPVEPVTWGELKRERAEEDSRE